MRNDIISSLALKRICYILLRTWVEWWLNRRRHIILPPSPQRLKQRKGKSREKGGKRKLAASENRRKRACLIFHSLMRGAPPWWGLWAGHIWYSQERMILVFPNWKHSVKRYSTSKTDKACSRYLCRANCFARETQEIIWDFCTWGWRNFQLSYRTISKYKWFVWDSNRCCCKLCF